MRRAVGIPLHRDGGHADDGRGRKLCLDIVVARLAFSESQPPAVIVNRDVDMVRIVEGRRAAIESGVVEIPLRRSSLPDQLRELTPILFVTGAAAIGGKVELVPPFILRLWRQRDLAGFLVADEIAAHGNHGPGALWPERCEDVGGSPS